jgi:hypothetical protein
VSDRFDPARRVADAVLYEGYVLYPYRASAAKNQVRWQFGVLAPRRWSEAGGSDGWSMRTECVVDAAPAASVDVRVRCLQVEARTVEAVDDVGMFRPVATLEAGGRQWTTWDGAVEHEVDLAGIPLEDTADSPVNAPAGRRGCRSIELPGSRTTELVVSEDGTVAGRIVIERQPLIGSVRVEASHCEGPYRLVRLAVTVDNLTPWPDPPTVPAAAPPRHEAMRWSLIAVHTMLAVDGGRFVSQIDPPEFARGSVEGCRNVGTYPVLAGPSGRDDLMLSSPIILYDHPEVAPESQGDLCDATEIDEILALRVLTLSDEEKAEVRGTDARAAAILERCELMPPEVWGRLHGAIRSLRPASSPAIGPDPGWYPDCVVPAAIGDGELAPWWEPEVDSRFDPWSDTVLVGAVELVKGSRVTLRPARRADAQDLFLAGRAAKVAGVFHDVDDEIHLAVVLDDDPGAELHEAHGRYLYFRPDEVEPLQVGP